MPNYKHDYLFRKANSQNWYVRVRRDGKDTIRSLGTPDRQQAEVLALPMIGDHKAALLASKPHLEWCQSFTPGEHPGPDGGRIIASERELIYLDSKGAYLRTEPNIAQRVEPPYPISSARQVVRLINAAMEEPHRAVPRNGDDAIFETYLKHANVTGFYEREARAAWELFKTLCHKPLKDATRDDGRKVAEHYAGIGNKSASIRKKVGWLNAAVNLAINEGKLKFNPFSNIVPKSDDGERRLPLDDADIRNIKKNLGELDKNDQLLIRLLATTGMRLAEAYQIKVEHRERGVRYVIVGSKTEQSLRRVPLPADVLSYLPKSIKGALFNGAGPRAASKRLNRFLNDIGIDDPRKVIHSLRHRAADKLRAACCPTDVRWALLGHEERSVAAGYGEGFPVTLLKKWVDKIGL
jgi:integrase